MNRRFLEALEEDVMVCDGAMGTMLYAKGIYINSCFEAMNIINPSLIREIHKDYINAGAEIIETNTFGANIYKLGPFGWGEKIREVNIRGAEIAKEASKGVVYVAGSVGPLGGALRPIGKITENEAKAAFIEQISALVEGGIDLLIVETMPDLREIKQALAAAKEVCDLPIIAQMSFVDHKKTFMGDSPSDVVSNLREWGADVIGANCSVGPQGMLETMEEMVKIKGNVKLSAQPNAGMPRIVDNRCIYLSSPEYMAEYAKRMIQTGVQLVGGCCGSTPDHIKAIKGAVKALRPTKITFGVQSEKLEKKPEAAPSVAMKDKSSFGAKLWNKFAVSIELDPPKGLNLDKVIEGARVVKESGVDAINIADGPRATARMSPMSMATIVQREVGIDILLHYCCRDRNLLGMQADLIGAHALGFRNLILITGDPPKLGDYPDATAVFDVDAIGLVRMVHNLNEGYDMALNSIGDATSFLIGVGANPGAIDIDLEVERFRQKVAAGAEYVLTQPVYDARLLENFLAKTSDIKIPVLVGILPLASQKNAEFLHNEVPGMQIPQKIRDRMAKYGSGDRAREEGIQIARETLIDAKDMVQGTYIMPPFGRYVSAIKVVEVLGK